MEEYSAINPDLKNKLKDGLDLHDQHLVLLFKPGHYDLLYESSYIHDHRELLESNKAFMMIIGTDKEKLGKCVLCKKLIESSTQMSKHACNPMHNYCLNDVIMKITNDRALYTKTEERSEKQRECPICHKRFTNDDMQLLFDNTAYDLLKQQKQEREGNVQQMRIDKENVRDQEMRPVQRFHEAPPLEAECKLCNIDCIHDFHENTVLLHSCGGGYLHYSCLLKPWNILCGRNYGRSKDRVSLLSDSQLSVLSGSFVCPLCEQPVGRTDLKRIIEFDRERMPRNGDRGNGSLPPKLTTPSLLAPDIRKTPRPIEDEKRSPGAGNLALHKREAGFLAGLRNQASPPRDYLRTQQPKKRDQALDEPQLKKGGYLQEKHNGNSSQVPYNPRETSPATRSTGYTSGEMTRQSAVPGDYDDSPKHFKAGHSVFLVIGATIVAVLAICWFF